MVIAALVSFGILLVAWAVAPEKRQAEGSEKVVADFESIPLAA